MLGGVVQKEYVVIHRSWLIFSNDARNKSMYSHIDSTTGTLGSRLLVISYIGIY